jgi:hypothetical protein
MPVDTLRVRDLKIFKAAGKRFHPMRTHEPRHTAGRIDSAAVRNTQCQSTVFQIRLPWLQFMFAIQIQSDHSGLREFV